MKTKKIDAFTLSEMLIVLVITSLVVSLTFLILDTVQKQLTTIKTNFKNQQQYQLLERLLWKDFNSYNISYSPIEDTFLMTNAIDTITYDFSNDYILRQNDTIFINFPDKSLFLDGKEVTKGTIDAMKLYTNPTYNFKQVFIYKQNDAAFYLNN